MTIVADTPRIIHGECGGLGDIVQHDSQSQFEGGVILEKLQHDESVDVDISLRVELGWLPASLESEELGHDVLHETAFHQKLHASAPRGVSDNLAELAVDTFGADPLEEAGICAHGLPGGRMEFESRSDCEANCPQETKRILLEPVAGDADRTKNLV